jgi:ElaB/YqjD/DUF883 family membrane-anchored ribosome-binding protein
MAPTNNLRDATSGIASGLLFFAVVLAGAGYIVFSKLHGFSALYATLIPVLIMIAYALLLTLARLFRLRDDQSGDNLYYMGFLFTLTSLAVSLFQFSSDGKAEQIVQNFGIAIASTIAGITLRIFFNQMRRDPIEVEHTARLELADASRKVRRELESTVLEFGYFRRATQQSITDAVDEVNTTLKDAKSSMIERLGEFAAEFNKPLKDASEKSGETIEQLNSRIAQTLEAAAKKLADETAQLSKSTAAAITSIDRVVSKLVSLQTPEQIIEIKLNPAIQGLSRVVNSLGKSAEIQANTVDANLRQTQSLLTVMTALLQEIRGSEAPPTTPPPLTAGTKEPRPLLTLPPRFDKDGQGSFDTHDTTNKDVD